MNDLTIDELKIKRDKIELRYRKTGNPKYREEYTDIVKLIKLKMIEGGETDARSQKRT